MYRYNILCPTRMFYAVHVPQYWSLIGKMSYIFILSEDIIFRFCDLNQFILELFVITDYFMKRKPNSDFNVSGLKKTHSNLHYTLEIVYYQSWYFEVHK